MQVVLSTDFEELHDAAIRTTCARYHQPIWLAPRVDVKAAQELLPRHGFGRDGVHNDRVSKSASCRGERAAERRLARTGRTHDDDTHALRARDVQLKNLLHLEQTAQLASG
jgi:hypothetical protein